MVKILVGGDWIFDWKAGEPYEVIFGLDANDLTRLRSFCEVGLGGRREVIQRVNK